MSDMSQRRAIFITLPLSLLQRLDELARREERTRQAQIRRLLTEALGAGHDTKGEEHRGKNV